MTEKRQVIIRTRFSNKQVRNFFRFRIQDNSTLWCQRQQLKGKDKKACHQKQNPHLPFDRFPTFDRTQTGRQANDSAAIGRAKAAWLQFIFVFVFFLSPAFAQPTRPDGGNEAAAGRLFQRADWIGWSEKGKSMCVRDYEYREVRGMLCNKANERVRLQKIIYGTER